MNTDIKYKVFEGDGHFVDTNLLDGITQERRELWIECMNSGHYADGIRVDKFLREDLSINLEKLELAVTLAVEALEANSPDEDVTLKLRGLNEYYSLREITELLQKQREERTFILTFVTSVASEASKRDTLIIKYVQ